MSKLYRNLVDSIVEYKTDIIEINLKMIIKEKRTALQLFLTKREFKELRDALNSFEIYEERLK